MPDGTEPVDPEPADLTPVDPADDAPDLPEPPGSRVVVRAQRWDAPLPPPGVLQRYEEILPGAAERILAMAENQQQNRLAQENAFVAQEQYALETARSTHTADSGRSKLGLIFAFIVALAGLGAGTYLINAGFGGLSLAVIFAPLSALVGVFVYADRARRAERRRNARDDESD